MIQHRKPVRGYEKKAPKMEETPSKYTGILLPESGSACVFDLWFELYFRRGVLRIA
jgi:hypothetical protein